MNRTEQQHSVVLAVCVHSKMPTEIAMVLECSRQSVYQIVETATGEANPKQMPTPQKTEELINPVQDVIGQRSGKATVKVLVRQFNISRRTMDCLINNNLGLHHSFKRMPRQALKPVDKEEEAGQSKEVAQ